MPNLLLIAMTIATIVMLSSHSAKHNEEQSRAEVETMPEPPEHAMLDNHVSGNVVAFCVLVAIAGTLLAFAAR